MADEWDAAEEARRYQGTPYDRATYMRLQRLMAPIQATTNDSHKRFNNRGMSPPPTTQGYRDKEQYLFVNKDIFERETAAMKACTHSKNPVQCGVARAMMHGSQAPPMSMTASDRLAAIGRSGKGAAASFLARQLTHQPEGSYDKRQLDAMRGIIQGHHSATSTPSSPKKEGPSKRSRGGNLRKSRKSRKSRKGHKSRTGRKK